MGPLFAAALDAFTASPLGQANPRSAQVFEDAWDRFTPFLAFPPELRRVIYTTNAIESLNFQLRKIIKNRGHFPNDQAAVKLLWLAMNRPRFSAASFRVERMASCRRRSIPSFVNEL